MHGPPEIRLVEIAATLALATDAGMGLPEGLTLRAAVIARGLAEAAGLSDDDQRDAFDAAMMRMCGCTAESSAPAAVMGDEIRVRAHLVGRDSGDMRAFAAVLAAHIAEDAPLPARALAVARGFARLPSLYATALAHCESAAMLVGAFGMSARVALASAQLFERWDGSGMPGKLRGDAIEPVARIATIAYEAASTQLALGTDAVAEMLRARAGRAFDPRLAELLAVRARGICGPLDSGSVLEQALASEPGRVRMIGEADVDETLAAIADFADLKSPWTAGHSRGVADLSRDAARHAGLAEPDVLAVRRSGLVHDVGRVAVSASVWNKRGALTALERERAESHTYAGARILGRAPAMATLAPFASLAHERCDGSGYHRGARIEATPLGARLLAAGDVAHALCEDRPHRKATTRERAAAILRELARSGRLCPDAVEAVVRALGLSARARTTRPGGLSEREIDVLRLAARGLTNKEIAAALDISPKTAGHHLEKVFAKAGVTTRAGATLWAMRQGLLDLVV